MRELKMKVWVDNKRMIGPFDLSQSPTYWAHKLEDGERLLYTGLTDKNGVEIYEGDILNHKYFDEERKEQSAMVVMKHDEHNYDYGGKCIGFDINGYWGSDFEIIGNIYENPELMEESK